MKYTNEQQQQLNQLTKNVLAGNISTEPQELIQHITNIINYQDWRYYVLSDPLIADIEYDTLFKQLKKLELDFPQFLQADSPTQRVADVLNEEFETVAHTIPMLSLDNSYNADDLNDFDRRVKEKAEESQITYVVEPKFDGASIALIYENDLLVRAATRGNGTLGDNITNNAKAIKSIPLKANFSKFGIQKIELRGEVVIEKGRFDDMNLQREQQGLSIFQNSRNTASGGLRMKDPKKIAERNLEAFIYQVGYVKTIDGNEQLIIQENYSHNNSIEILAQLGFKTPTVEKKVFNTIEGVIEFAQEWEEKRDNYNYDIDGLVIKVDDYRLQEKIGSTAHHPRWAMAYKFKAKQATTKLLAIEYQVGRTGAITPVAKVEPVRLVGVTISSISLHNEEMITQKDIRIGDTVIVERAGDVIPYIVGPVKDLRNGSEQEFRFIHQCPSCNSPLEKPQGDAVWRCINVECPAQAEERIIHFVSKNAMDISGLGKDIVKRFIDENIITTILDIYNLNPKTEQILALEGWKERSLNKLLKNIEASKQKPLWRLMVGLGIRHIGTTMAKQLTKEVTHINDFKIFSTEELLAMNDVGPKVAQSIYDFFHTEKNIHTINELERMGVNVENEKQDEPTSQLLANKTFLFTGSLQQFTRDQAKEIVEQNGGKVLSGVSKKLDYLIAGEKAGSKLTKAQAIETITILTEEEFLAMIR